MKFKFTLFFVLIFCFFQSTAFAKTHFKVLPGDHLPDFRLLCSDGKSYTLSNFASCDNIVFLFLTGSVANNAKSVEHLKSIAAKYSFRDASFVVVSQHLNKGFLQTDSSNHANLIYLIDYHDNAFTTHLLTSTEPVLLIYNKQRQLFFHEELITTSSHFDEVFSTTLPKELTREDFKFEKESSKSDMVIDKSVTDKNYGLSIHLLNLDDKAYLMQNILNEGYTLLYFWSVKWDKSTFELEDLNFTTQTLKSVGIKLVPINVDGKRYMKKVWLTLFNNSCYGEHFLSETALSDAKFSSFNNIINPRTKANYVLLSKEGEVLFSEEKIVSLIEMRKTMITELKKHHMKINQIKSSLENAEYSASKN